MQTVFVSDALKAQFREIARQPVDPAAAAAILRDASAAVDRLAQQTAAASYLDPEVAERQVGTA